MPDLTELDAKVREDDGEWEPTTVAELEATIIAYDSFTKPYVAKLISAVRRHERARCRQAVEGEDTEYLDTDWARGVSAAITDALAAIDALEG